MVVGEEESIELRFKVRDPEKMNQAFQECNLLNPDEGESSSEEEGGGEMFTKEYFDKLE
jgi:hypothetical protein